MPQYELNLRDYWLIIQKRRLVMLAIFAVVLISTIIFTNTQQPLYRASASVQWIERRTVGALLTELVTVPSGDPLLTQARVIKGQPIMEKVLEKVGVKFGLIGKDASKQEITIAARGLLKLVETEVVRDTSIIRIDVAFPDARPAAEIANNIAQVYIDENTHERNKQNRLVREFIQKQLEELKTKLKHSEETLSRFKETEVSAGLAASLEKRLSDLEAKRHNLMGIYTERHPDIKNIEEEMLEVKGHLQTLPQKELEYSRLEREVEINSRLYRDLKEKFEAARIAEAEQIEDVILVDHAVAPSSPVSPNKPLNYLFGIMVGLMLGLAAAFTTEQLDTSIGTIEDVENYLQLPALGIIPYLKVEGKIKKGFVQRLWPRELKGEEKIANMRKQLLVHYSSSSPIFEAYRMLRTNIQTEVFKEKMQKNILLLTSSGPEEGKSITISNLAVVMAQGKLRTLLIDADMRRSTIHKVFGFKNRGPGLCDVLRGTVQPEAAIRTITDILMGDLGFDETLKVPGLDNLNILTAGSLPTTPAELLASREMAPLLENLRTKYDLILIDTPPVLAVADAVILAPLSDAVALVYRVGKTARSVVVRAKQQLVETGSKVKGVILNNISQEIEMRYSYYYHYKYYGKYYGEKKEGA